MPTDAEHFQTIQLWRSCNSEDQDLMSESDSKEWITPLLALSATRDLIDSLLAGRWHMVTAARLEGIAWCEIAQAMNYIHGADALRKEYAGLVEWFQGHPSIAVDVTQWCTALNLYG